MLKIRNLTVKYDKVILDSVNLDLEKKTYGLVGVTGSGKSTFVKALAGFIRYEGSIVMNGEILKKRRKGFQIVFQNPLNSFDPKKTLKYSIEEIIRLNSTGYTSEEMIEKVGLDKDIGFRYPHELSGGELQRMSIARALAGDPEVLIMDEPTSALDMENRKKVLDILKMLKGRTVILVSHDLNAVKYVSDRILTLDSNTKKIFIVSGLQNYIKGK